MKLELDGAREAGSSTWFAFLREAQLVCFSSIRRRSDNKHAVRVFQVNIEALVLAISCWSFSQAWCLAHCQFPKAFGPFRAVAGLSWVEHPASWIAKWIPQVARLGR